MMNKKKNQLQEEEKSPSTGSSVQTVLNFVESLTRTQLDENDARVLVCKNSFLKYLLLDVSNQFNEIVKKAFAVVLVGGTLHPIENVVLNLIPNAKEGKVKTFSCSHVVRVVRWLGFVV